MSYLATLRYRARWTLFRHVWHILQFAQVVGIIKSLSIPRHRSQDQTYGRRLTALSPSRRTRSAIPRDESNIIIDFSSHIKQNDTMMFQRKSLIIRNMKVLSVIALAVLALGVVTFKSVASLPKLKSAPGTPFDWQKFLPGGKIFQFQCVLFSFLSSLSLYVDTPNLFI